MTSIARRSSTPILALALVLASVAARAEHEEADADVGVVRATSIAWVAGPPSLPAGPKIAVLAGAPAEAGPFTLRLRFPAGTRVLPHVHPATEHVTVVQGRIGIGAGETFDESKLQWMTRGDFFWVTAGAPHYGQSKAVTIIEIDATGPWGMTYVNEEDDPSADD
jgi:quercetin dioxygenase-like cupin family protein